MHLIVLYLLACALMGFAGRHRRFGFVGFFLISMFLTPILALIILIVSAPAKESASSPTL